MPQTSGTCLWIPFVGIHGNRDRGPFKVLGWREELLGQHEDEVFCIARRRHRVGVGAFSAIERVSEGAAVVMWVVFRVGWPFAAWSSFVQPHWAVALYATANNLRVSEERLDRYNAPLVADPGF